MRSSLFFESGRPRLATRAIVTAVCAALGLLPMAPAWAAPGDILKNGTTVGRGDAKRPGVRFSGFLFEPEVPFTSLKSVPIWNELEQIRPVFSSRIVRCAAARGP